MTTFIFASLTFECVKESSMRELAVNDNEAA